ncbi:ShlB/FhaC/HecB family hemolysin secretion/activation protein [Calothrix sp. 336/3]|uniref:ShlB/FhaC/HecB family hemolysin secretion/activation protein n=1 Tax=Calothrix sp. 336/3 TaxID=1337936 RepID=UPI001EDFEE49|nr:ShlB/FhaC/HecB family hemolysin secretion/activation protein [Calothrix sp. 336/3]
MSITYKYLYIFGYGLTIPTSIIWLGTNYVNATTPAIIHTQNTPETLPEGEPSLTPQPETPETPQPEQKVLVNQVEVTGYQVFQPAEINAITQAFIGKSLTVSELADIADKITELYLKQGYITSRAVLVDQTFTNGIVQIRVFEGGVDQILVEGTNKVKPEYIRSRIRLAGLNPLRKDKLEEQLILLRTDPLFKNVEGSIRSAGAGSKFGQSILTIRVIEADAFQSNVSIDNYSPPTVGSERMNLGLGYRNLITSGDQISANYSRSTTGGANIYDFSYRVPVNAKNGTIQLRTLFSNYQITDPGFKSLNIRGDSNLYEITYRQPLVRSPKSEFALSWGFSHQNGQTFLFDNLPFPFGIGPDSDGVSRTSVFHFGQDYIKRDTKGAWALRSQFNLGTGLFNATINNHPTPDSRFFSWTGQAQRVQQLSDDQLLIAMLDIQLTPHSLLPSQQFVIGGVQSLRGYRQNLRSGDNGVRLSLEDRITIHRNAAGATTLQIIPFIDVGTVWNHPDNPNKVPRQKFLSSLGLGLLWEPLPKLNLRLDYGIPLINVRDRGENLQDTSLYFSVSYQP